MSLCRSHGPRAVLLLATSAAALLSGQPARAALRTGLLPPQAVNLTVEQARNYQRQLIAVLRRTAGIRLTDSGPLRRRLAALPADCPESSGCLRKLGLLGLDRLLALRVGQLGGTVLLRLTVFDLDQGTRQGSWQETLRGAEPKDPQVQRALQRMVNGFAPSPDLAAPRPWYTRWWVWTAAGAVVAAAVTTAVVLSIREDGPEPTGPDVVIDPPAP